MPTVSLPSEPNLGQLKKQAKDLQRAVRANDPGYPLRSAQLVIARHYGFTSWARLKAHLDVVARYTRAPDRIDASDDPANEFLRLACLSYADDGPERWERARALLDAHPEIRAADIYTAATVADRDRVRTFLASDPALARRDGGPFSWTPLFYLAYARHDPDVDLHAVLDTAAA